MSLKRRRAKEIARITVAVVVLQLAAAPDAQAYLDAGTASFIFQTVVAAILTGFFVMKGYWRALTQRVRRRFSRELEPPRRPEEQS